MAPGTELTPASYIQHHLTFFAKPVGEGGFWTLHVDSLVTAALLGVMGEIQYEAQAAIELEMLAAEGVDEAYDWDRSSAHPMVIDPAPLLRGVVSDMMRGVDTRVISAKFHNTIAAVIAAVSEVARQRAEVNRVALSGGVFQNVYLLERTLGELERRGFETLTHHQAPANDGGIALGQAVIASARVTRKGS